MSILNFFVMIGMACLSCLSFGSSDSLAAGSEVGAVRANASGPPRLAPFASGVLPQDANGQAGGVDYRVVADDQFSNCGQDCILAKANENLSFQIGFILKKKNYLLTQQDPSDALDEKDPLTRSKRQILGNFCFEGNLTESMESTQDCARRWLKINEFWLLKAQGSIGKNQGSIARLAGVECSSGGCSPPKLTPNFFEAGIPNSSGLGGANPLKFAQAPAFSTANQLAQQAGAKMAKLNAVTDNGEWASKMASQLKPQIEDFVQFKLIPRDPSNPAAGSMEVPVMNSQGNALKYDRAAYQLAFNQWQKTFGSLEVSGDARGTVLEKTLQSGSIQTKIDQNRAEMISNFSSPASSANKSLDRKFYDDERDEYVGAVNQMITGQASNQGIQKKTVPGSAGAGSVGAGMGAGSSGEAPVNYPAETPLTNAEGNMTTIQSHFYSISNHGSQFAFTPATPPVLPATGTNSSVNSVAGGPTPQAPVAPRSSPQSRIDQVTDPGSASLNLDFNDDAFR